MNFISTILSDEHNEELIQYTIRTYSRIFNSSPIQQEVLINGEYKTLIKPYIWTTKQEPLTEQIVMYDIEIKAINVDHARSIAYNYSKNLNAYLSVLLDVGFELITSEFRVFVIKQGIQISLQRYRTGFIDLELNLLVQNNLNGLIDLNNMDEINSFHRGKEILNFELEGIENSDSFIFKASDSNDFLEKLFQKYVLFSQNHHRFIRFLSQLPHRIFSEQTLKPAHDGRCFQVPPISVSPGGIFYFVNICRIQYSV